MKEVHLICNAHIDPIWQWDWQEGVSATVSTFNSAVNLAGKYDYIFCHNEASIYKYVEEYAPSLFEKIKELVKEGKWHIMGGWYLQPDCNMLSGESFVRQIMEGKRYFKSRFGIEPKTAVNFDPFGHTVGLVQIIKKCGQDSYMFMRPYSSEMDYPSDRFIWRGLDGGEIKALHTGSYNSPLGKSAQAISERVETQRADGHEIGAVTWGVGNHGGGPSDKDLADIEKMQHASPIPIIHSTPENFFASIEPTAVCDTSLRISMPGCYTSMHKVKAKHALLENEIFATEKMLTAAYMTGALREYPQEEMRSAVEDLMNAQFHDVLPGTSVRCGEDSGIKLLEHGRLTVERLKTRAYFALCSTQPSAKEGEYPIVVFNPHPYELKENVECEFSLSDQNWSLEEFSHFTLLDEDGKKIKYQVVKEDSNINLDWRKRIVFEATLKPLALTRYSLFVDFKAKSENDKKEKFVFDNGRKRVEIDTNTGLIKSYSIDGKEYIKDAFSVVSFADNADPWAMGKSQLERVGDGEEIPLTLSARPNGVFARMNSVQVVEDGEIYLGVEAFFKSENTRARVLYKIYKNNDAVDVDVDLFLGDVDRIYKVKIPMACGGELLGQTAFGQEKLYTDGRENVSLRFITKNYGDKNLVVMNDGTYGSHFENGALYLSLVRGVTYCAHPIPERELLPAGRFTKKVDMGENNFSFRIDLVDKKSVERKTQEFVQKPYAVNVFPVYDASVAVRPFTVRVLSDAVSLAAMKKADGTDGVILRLVNNNDSATECGVSVNGVEKKFDFGKYEVKTLLFCTDTLEESKLMII